MEVKARSLFVSVFKPRAYEGVIHPGLAYDSYIKDFVRSVVRFYNTNIDGSLLTYSQAAAGTFR
jgi:hypothetical protein